MEEKGNVTVPIDLCRSAFARMTDLLYQCRGVGARSAPHRAATYARLCVHIGFNVSDTFLYTYIE